MGKRGDLIRRLGFGGSKCGLSPPHEKALASALRAGIRFLDTAPNYGQDGSSERLIGNVLKQDVVRREEVTLATKVGYYSPLSPQQGAGPDSIKVRGAPQWYYSIHPEVVRAELKASLERLQQDYVDLAYVHNPEAYVADLLLPQQDGGGGGGDGGVDAATIRREQDKLKGRLTSTFSALEELVQEGKIRGYGVSSNGLAASPSDASHVALDDVLEAASEAASRAGRVVPALRSIQMPINLLEPTGLICAAKARARGLDVVADRSLTGFYEGGLYRLVDKWAEKPPEGYMEACQAVLEYFIYKPEAADNDLTEEERETRQGCMIVQDLIRDLNKQLVHFTSYALFETELERRIIPLVYQTFESLDEEAVEKLTTFFRCYGDMVRFNSALKTRELVTSPSCPGGAHTIPAGQPLYDYALQWLLKKCPETVTTVLVGMTQEAHVQDAVRVATGDEANID